jgi:acetolactate synthase I/II/III large subunit
MAKAKTGAKAGTMTGGMAIVEALVANGVDTVFGLPGAQLYPLFDALQQRADQIRTIGARHEQACGYMAFGYARSTGRPGVYAVVPGPGVLNTTAALCTAYGCCAPVLCITGQVPSAFLGRSRGHLHELPDQLATLRSLTKWATRIERPADAPAAINEAFRQMLSGRPGPVAVEMAWDTMASCGFVEPPRPAAIAEPPAPSPLEMEAAAKLLAAAQRPMIVTGSGAQHASEAIEALAEELQAPVAAFRGGRGVVPEDHAFGISSYAAYRLWPETDALVAVGTRAEMPYMRWTGMMSLIDRPQAPPHLIRIDIDPAEMRRLVPHAGIVADAEAGARALLAAVRRLRGRKGEAKPPTAESAKTRASAKVAERIAVVKAEARAAIEKVQPQLAYLDVIREVLPRDGIFVTELSQVGFTSYFGYPVYGPRTYVTEGYQGTLGFGFPSALGVKVAHPDKPVVSVAGDGGFLFGVQELATAVQYGIAVVVLLFNNGAYGNVMRDQRTNFGNRVIGAALANPDFMLLARSFGVEAHRVASPEALRPVLKAALEAKGPVLIEIEVAQGSETSPWEFIHPKPHPPRA